MTPFDPDAAADPAAGIYGLPTPEQQAAAVVIPVPFGATVSYGGGAEQGPAAVLEGSLQVDLYDLHFGRTWARGIHARAAHPAIAAAHVRARQLAEPLIEAGGAGPADQDVVGEIDQLCGEVHRLVADQVAEVIDAGRLPVVLGGDHSCSLGGLLAADRMGQPFGVLQFDAHGDLRDAYEGFAHSHASILHNALRECGNLQRLVQVGIRDVGEGEWSAVRDSAGRIICHTDPAWRRRLASGETFHALCQEVVDALPERIWITCDIDGLDPSLCPNTGTPVPGGLSYGEFCHLLEVLAGAGRQVIGVDLMEVAPGSDGDGWDGNVGARVLYKLIGCGLRGRD